jgi:hypothetical protein
VHYRSKPNSCKRIETNLSSALVFIDKLPVNAIDAARVDKYKMCRAPIQELSGLFHDGAAFEPRHIPTDRIASRGTVPCLDLLDMR